MKQLRSAALSLALFTLMGPASADVLSVTLDNKGTVALGGTMLLISGTVTCDVPADSFFSFLNLFGNAIQISVGGKVVSQGFFGGSPQCAGAATPVPYMFQVASFFGGSPFKPGHADVNVTASQFGCSPFGCTSSVKTAHDKVILNP